MNKKKEIISIISVIVLGLSALPAAVNAEQQTAAPLAKIAPYPPAKQGQKRYVLHLPKKENEGEYKVEISLGKMLTVDCNRYFLTGELREETLQGWGYKYFVLDKTGVPASTQMACPSQQRSKQFIMIASATRLERYNSQLPLVVYAPQDIEMRYRIWQADKAYLPVTSG